LRGTPFAELLDERGHRIRGHREVVDAVALGAALLVDLLEVASELVLGIVGGEVERAIRGRLGEPVPDLLAEVVAAELAHGGLHLGAELVVRPLRAGSAEDRELLGQHAAQRERVERGEDLAPGQVARGAEDHERARLGRLRQREPFEEGVLALLAGAGSRRAEPGSADA
jgi:hypothetical protein